MKKHNKESNTIDFTKPILDERGNTIHMEVAQGEPYLLTLAEATILALKVGTNELSPVQNAQRSNLVAKIAGADKPIQLSEAVCKYIYDLIVKVNFTLPIVNVRCATMLGIAAQEFNEDELLN